MDNFTLKIIAGLDKVLSKRMIKSDLKSFDGQFTVKVIASLNKVLSQRALKQTLKELTNLNVNVNAKLNKTSSEAQLRQQVKALQAKIEDLDVRLKANTEQLNTTVRQAANNAQRVADQVPIEYKVSIKKDKLISDLSLLAKQNSKLFTNSAATQKYGKLLDDAYGATTGGDISELTLRMAAFKSELKATNLSGLTLADTFKKTVGRAGELVSATSMVMVAYSQARKAYTEVKALDDSMTGLYKVADEIRSRDDFPAYLDKAIAKAKELSVETKSLISSVTNWKKIGFGLGLSEELAETSTKLEKTGDMSIDKATNTLISTLQAFKEIDGLTEEQYSERALAIADKINHISNTRSIDAEGISDALQNSVATLQEANNDLNQSIAMATAANKIYQSPSEVGNTLKILSMRLRGVSEDGEQAEESVAKLRDTILNLTNDKVDIMLDENTFKSTYDILLEISKVYDSLSDKSQALLLEKIAGKQRGASTAALLQNMSEAEAIYQDALNSTGSVNREFERYQESASAAVTRFKETLVDTYTGILSGDMIKGAADTGSAILDLANKFNLLQSSIIGITAIGTVKGITAIGNACLSSAKQMSMLGDAINRVNSLPTDEKKREKALYDIGTATKGLSDKQNKLLLSNKNLETSDRMNILAGQGVIKSKREEKLATLGLTQATEAQTAANVKATTSTFSLKAAVTGLGASMKAAFMSNPVGISLMALSVTIGALVGQYQKYRQEIEETRQKNIEAAESASAQANKLKDLYTQYMNLSSITNRTVSQEQEMQKAVEDITVALGDKAKTLEGLTVGTQDYADALREATKAELESQYATAVRGRKAAEENLHEDVWSNWDGSQIDIPLNVNMTGIKSHAQALSIVRDMLSEFEKETSKGTNWAPESYDDMDSVVEYYHALIEARERLTLQSKELGDDSILDSDIYKNMDKAITQISESIETYTKNRYEELKAEYATHNAFPTTVEDFNNMKNAILNASGAGENLKQELNDLLTADFSSLAVQAQNAIVEKVDSKRLLPWTEDQNKQIDEYQNKIKSLGEAVKSLADGSMTHTKALDLIQEYGIDPNKVDMSTGAFIGLREELDRISKLSFVNILSVIGEMRDGGFIDESTYSTLSQIFHDMAYNIDDSAKSLSDWKKQLQDSRSSISALSEILKELNTDGIKNISSSSIDKIISDYPQLLSYINDEQVLRNEIQKELEKQEASAKTAYANMMQADEDFYKQILQNEASKVSVTNDTINSIVNGNAELVSVLGGYYNADIGNFKSLADAKAKIEETLIKNCAAAWAQYYKVQVVNGVAATNAMEGGVHSGEEAAARSAAIAATSAYNQAIQSLEDLSNISIGAGDIGSIGGSGGSGGSKSKAPSEFDTAAESIKNLRTQLDSLNTILENTDPYSQKLDTLKLIIAKQKEYNDALKSQADVYQAEYQKSLAALPQQWQDNITGDKNFSIDEIPASLKDAVTRAQDFKDKWTSVNESILQANKELENTKQKVYDLAQTKLDNQIGMIENKISDVQNKMDEAEAMGLQATKKQYKNMISLSKQEASVYQDKLQGLIAVMAAMEAAGETDTDNYYKTAEAIQSCEDAISKCAQSQAKWNKAMLELPIQYLERANDELNDQLDGLKEEQNRLDGAISGVTAHLQDQIDAQQKLRDEAEKAADEKIDAINKEKEALQETNEKRKQQLELEKAQYNLERAKNQKTVRIFREDSEEFEYENDKIAELDAQNAKDELDFNKHISDLDNQIKDIEKSRDELLNSYDEEIDRLQIIMDTWNDITDAIERAKHMAMADSMLGTGWKDRVTSGDTSDIGNITGKYEQNDKQQTWVEQQIEANERLIREVERYVEAWQMGEMSIREARESINDIVGDIAPEIEANDERVNSISTYQSQWTNASQSVPVDIAAINAATTNNVDELTATEQRRAAAQMYADQWATNVLTVGDSLNSITTANSDATIAEGQFLDTRITKLTSFQSSYASMASNIAARCREIVSACREAERALERLEKKESGGGGGSSKKWDSSGASGGPGVYADGILKGKIGGNGADEKEKMLQYLSTNELNDDEIPVIAHKNEVILNTDQQDTIARNINDILSADPKSLAYSGKEINDIYSRFNITDYNSFLPDYSKFSKPDIVINKTDNQAPSIQINKIEMHEVNDADEFLKDLSRHFPQSMSGQLTKHK